MTLFSHCSDSNGAEEPQLAMEAIKCEPDAMDTNTVADTESAKDQPDADNIKMFVGQIPKTWDELKLRRLFEQFGRVHTLNVLRDKVTSISRGECTRIQMWVLIGTGPRAQTRSMNFYAAPSIRGAPF